MTKRKVGRVRAWAVLKDGRLIYPEIRVSKTAAYHRMNSEKRFYHLYEKHTFEVVPIEITILPKGVK